jgi:hypothetical protein
MRSLEAANHRLEALLAAGRTPAEGSPDAALQLVRLEAEALRDALAMRNRDVARLSADLALLRPAAGDVISDGNWAVHHLREQLRAKDALLQVPSTSSGLRLRHAACMPDAADGH